MRIAIPITIELGKAGGLETYAVKLVRGLQEIDDKNEYQIYCTIFNEEAFHISKGNFKKIFTGRSKSIEKAKLRILPYIGRSFEYMEENRVLRPVKKFAKKVILGAHRKISPPKEIQTSNNYDLLHYLFTIFPFYEKFSVPVILSMADIQHEFYPEFFSKGELESRNRYFKPSAEAADHIIAISEYTKKTIVEKYGIKPDKITVVHLGFNADEFKPINKEAVDAFRLAKKLPQKYLLYPAATWPHKNHLNLVRAYKILKDKFGLKHKLVLSGIKKNNHGPVESEIRKLGLVNDVIYLGYLPYKELPMLYNAAHLMVFPSLFEGFGMPVVEAMAAGLPVACSDFTSLPEVGGDAVVYFDPKNPDDMAKKISEACNDDELRKKLVANGLKRSKLFTWEKTARSTLDVYTRVYSSSGLAKSSS